MTMQIEDTDSAAAQPADTQHTPRASLTGPVTAAAPLLAIDPGNTESAYCVIDAPTRRPLHFGKIPNDQLLDRLVPAIDVQQITHVVIEMIASYGMPVGAEVFNTCVWIGRFQQEALHAFPLDPIQVDLVKRLPVKVHHCHDSKAKDSNITQALVDRFAPAQTNHGKGTKAAPGWFYGFAKDVWQAYALAVYVADTASVTPLNAASAAVSPPCAADAAPASGAPAAWGSAQEHRNIAATITEAEAMF